MTTHTHTHARTPKPMSEETIREEVRFLRTHFDGRCTCWAKTEPGEVEGAWGRRIFRADFEQLERRIATNPTDPRLLNLRREMVDYGRTHQMFEGEAPSLTANNADIIRLVAALQPKWRDGRVVSVRSLEPAEWTELLKGLGVQPS